MELDKFAHSLIMRDAFRQAKRLGVPPDDVFEDYGSSYGTIIVDSEGEPETEICKN